LLFTARRRSARLVKKRQVLPRDITSRGDKLGHPCGRFFRAARHAITAVPYLNALKLDREELVQALGLSFLVATVALGLSLAGSNAFTPAQAWQSGLALFPALAGMAVGTALRRRLPAEVFRRWFLVGLLLLGLYLALR
jgi:uncharacterized membrane protein YfcA